MAKENALAIMKRINSKNGENTIARDKQFRSYSRIPFSSAKLNYSLYGGAPRGAVIQFWGDKGGGKTTTALDLSANAQELFEKEFKEDLVNPKIKVKPTAPLKVLYIDAENTLDEAWATKLGVNLTEMIIMNPIGMYTEEILQDTVDLINTGEFGLVVLDSLPAMLSKQATEKKIEEKTYAGNSIALTRFSSLLTQACGETGCCFVGINQVRDNMDANSWVEFKTTGGRAWGHALVVDLFFKKGRFIDAENKELKSTAANPAGNLVMVDVLKTKICPPDRRMGYYTLNYSFGIDFVADTLDVAIDMGFVIKSGSWFSVTNPKTGEVLEVDGQEKIQGFFNFCDAVYEVGMYEDIEKAVNAKLSEFNTPERMLNRKGKKPKR